MSSPHPRQEFSMRTHAVTPLRHRMIEDMNARKLCAGTQRGHIHSCKRFAVFLNRSPDTATTEDIRSVRDCIATRQCGRRLSSGYLFASSRCRILRISSAAEPGGAHATYPRRVRLGPGLLWPCGGRRDVQSYRGAGIAEVANYGASQCGREPRCLVWNQLTTRCLRRPHRCSPALL